MGQGTCSVVEDGEPCGRPRYCRGWCTKHYARWRAQGDPLALGRSGQPAVDPALRFWAKVDKDGPVPEYAPHLGPCWLWTGARTGGGYGNFTVRKGHWVPAHRFAYELVNGPIPEGLELDHLCRVRHCVNPAHLEPVTTRVNLLRGFGVSGVNARKTHCAQGHEFTPENTYNAPNGSRHCRQCGALWESKRKR